MSSRSGCIVVDRMLFSTERPIAGVGKWHLAKEMVLRFECVN